MGDGVGTDAEPLGPGGIRDAKEVETGSRHWEKLAWFGAKVGRVRVRNKLWLFNFEDKLYK